VPARHQIIHRLSRLLRVVPVVVLLAACSGSGPQTALEPLGPIGRDIDGVWDLVLMLATAVFVLVMGLLVWAMWRYRERPGDETEPKQLHGSSVIEVGGVVFSVVLLAFISVPTVRGLLDIREVPEGPDVLQIQVTGHQWWWEFEYVDETASDGRTLITANELHIPEDVSVYLTMTSADVIHSFWIPVLNGKRDVVPGRVTNLTLIADDPTPPGEPIPGQCAEFCGLAHADMRIKVHVHTAADYATWVDEQVAPSQQPAVDTALAPGWQTFSTLCTACHQVTVEDAGGEVTTHGPERHISADDIEFRSSFGPNLTHLFSRDTFASGTLTLDPDHLENLSQWIDDPESLKPMWADRNDLANGKVLGMPDLGLSPAEIEEVVDLLETWR
jgi:cytochrome c oxidase subunit 2